MPQIQKTAADLKQFVQQWQQKSLFPPRPNAIEAVDYVLELAKHVPLSWKYSEPEQQWTANPNFVAFRFPKTMDTFSVWIYTRDEITVIDELEFRGSRPKNRPTYQSVRISSPEQLPALEQYIFQAFKKRLPHSVVGINCRSE